MHQKYPALSTLFGGYYHEDWLSFDGTLFGPLRDFMATEEPEWVQKLNQELRTILAENWSETELAALTTGLKAEVNRTRLANGYASWFAELATLLNERSSDTG